ncbi:MAG: hypothetical protein COT25_02455 [Candidatus Kerfeldbacteria bacterium CG08_land_8_20_14_0_20_42_7]|uniref:DUF2029 domain-containing protein n=1 Tax=Candidatus Kerfeldbacteria bacterium CG08_land_8_20_14_0_20_42_7 TaxID=2014245 RepID=A0A2H0YUX5_9BACT|nr:MAG: hypothetical protein COT25_02455 [Candidatus Kerfeldbacteria bacterium CG08_land_8_20_14_0_20_42_7]
MNETHETSHQSSFAVVAILFVVLIAGSFLFRWVVKEQFSNPNNFSDFPSIQFAAHVLRTGGDPFDIQQVSTAASAQDAQLSTIVAPYRHSIAELLPFVALDHLSYPLARRIWMFGVAISAFGIAWVLSKYFSPWPDRDPRSWLLGVVPLVCVPFIYSVELHQTNTWLLLFLLAGALCLRKKWVIGASIFFAVAIVGKFFLAALLIILLMQKRYKVVIVTAIIAALLFFGSFAIFPGTWTSYTHTVVPELVSGDIHDNPLNPVKGSGSVAWWKNISLTGMAYRMFTTQDVVPPLVRVPLVPFVKAFGWILFAATIGVVWRYREWLRTHQELGFFLGLSAILLSWFIVSSLTWQHHLVFLLLTLPVLPLVFRSRVPFTVWLVLLIAGLFAINILATPPAQAPTWFQQLFVALPAIGLVACWFGAAGLLWKRQT